jgi:membrane associated rhomboid family serine protease
MSTSVVARVTARRPVDAGRSRPVLTAMVFTVTLAISIASLVSPTLMHLFVRDLPQLQAGQWWRVVTPVLVQPSGWGQLAFNLLGIAVVGAALQRYLGWGGWSLLYLVGGSGSIAVYSAWHPADTGGGSSAAIAALIGALAVLLVVRDGRGRLDWFAQLYSVFFAVYLSTLDLGGVVPSIIAGNATIIVMVIARRAFSHTAVTRACLVVVVATGIVMTAVRDDHGVGIAIGVTVGGLVLLRRRILPRPTPRLRGQIAVVSGVVAATALTWVSWVQLLGIPLVIRQSDGRESHVGSLSIICVTAVATLAAALTLSLLRRWAPAHGIHLWTGLCLATALISLAGPLTLAANTASMAAMTSLHLTCATMILALLTPSTQRLDSRPTPGAPLP